MLKLASDFHLRTMLMADLVKAVSGAVASLVPSYGDETQTSLGREIAAGKPVNTDFAIRVGWRLDTYSHKY